MLSYMHIFSEKEIISCVDSCLDTKNVGPYTFLWVWKSVYFEHLWKCTLFWMAPKINSLANLLHLYYHLCAFLLWWTTARWLTSVHYTWPPHLQSVHSCEQPSHYVYNPEYWSLSQHSPHCPTRSSPIHSQSMLPLLDHCMWKTNKIILPLNSDPCGST